MRNALFRLFLIAGLHGAALAQPSERSAALAAIAAADPAARVHAALALARSGEMQDVPALLERLREDDAPLVRGLAERAIWAIWSRSGDDATDALLARGVAEMQGGELDAAVATFTQVIERRPDFAEGWNKRATALFLRGDYRRSLADCDEVMRRNPYHFGALAGYGQIYLRLGEDRKALEHLRRALALNPTMEGVRALVEALEARLRAQKRVI
ncbi:MAG: tetratricopeptide repeat protein [Burkholderiales bacterium]|nr:tetratricopeptide repeat protein [Burkholderiales bacterium]